MKRLLLIVVGVSTLFLRAAPAELTQEQRAEAERTVKQFSAKQFAVRQKAVEELVAMGVDVLPLIRKTMAGTDDAEVKLRCGMVLKGIGEKFGIDVGPKKPARAFGLDASRVSVKVRGVPLDTVLDAFSEQSGNAVIEVPEGWQDKRITLEVADMPYWQALDALCRQAGLFYAPDKKTGRIKLLPAEDALDVSAYAGPVVVKLGRGESTRRGRRDMELRYRFDFICEDGLDVVAVDVRFTKYLDRDGKPLRREPAFAQHLPAVPGGVLHGYCSIRFTEVPPGTRELGVVAGEVTLTFGAGRQMLTFEDLFGRPENTITAGGATLTVKGVKRGRGRWVTMAILRTVKGDERPLPFFRSGSSYGFYLVDPRGGRHVGSIYQGDGGGFASLGALRKRRLVFRNVPEIKGKWKLECVLPATVTEKTYPFRFEKVPLP